MDVQRLRELCDTATPEVTTDAVVAAIELLVVARIYFPLLLDVYEAVGKVLVSSVSGEIDMADWNAMCTAHLKVTDA